MDIEKLREEIEYDEGNVKNYIFGSSGVYLLLALGHLVRESDPEHGWEVGTPVSNDRCVAAFNEDIETVVSDCYKLYPDFDDLPEEVKRIIANMMFNMGYPRLSKFKGMKRGVDARDWNSAADEMVDSRWYRQVTNRADRLVERMRNI